MKRKLVNLNKVLGVILGVLVIVAIAMVYTKNAKETEEALDKASQSLKAAGNKALAAVTKPAEEPEAEEPEAVKTVAEKVSFTASLVRSEPSDEEKALQEEYGEDAYLAADDKTEEEVSEEVERGRKMLTEDIFSYYESFIPEEFCYNSLSMTKDGEPSNVTLSAKEHKYVTYEINSALSTAFDSKKDDDEGISKELLEEHANPFFVSTMMRGIAPLYYVEGTRWGDVYDFIGKFIAEDRKAFAKDEDEFWKMMDEDKVLWKGYSLDIDFDGKPGLTYAEIPGKGGDGVDHWVLPAYDGEAYKVTSEYHRYAAKLAALLCTGDLISYEGIKDRSTVIKSVVDNRVAFGSGPEQERAGFMRSQFTDESNRQVTAPMLLFVARDKNGRASGDFFGIDYWDKNFEIPGGITKESGGKKIIIQDNPVNPVSTTAKLNNKSNPKTTATSTTTPTKNPPSNPPGGGGNKSKKDSNKNPKTPVSQPIQGQSDFQSVGTQPTNWGSTVEEAQHQSTAQTQAILDNGGQKTTPGTENTSVPTTGQTVTVTDETGQSHTGTATASTDPNTGTEVADVTYHDDSTGQDVKVDNAEVKTEPATDVDTSSHQEAGTSTSDSDFGYGY